MMRHLALVVGIAASVVIAWYVLLSGPGRASGSLQGVGAGDVGVPEPGTTGLGGAAGGQVVRRFRPPGPSTVISSQAGLHGLCQERGAVGERVYELVRKTAGLDARLLDRSFGRTEIAPIVNLWLGERRDQKTEDITFLIKVWEMVEDPTVRYALSYLFRHAQDDRVIGPLMELGEHHPWQAVDSIAAQGSDRAAQALEEIRDRIDKPEARNQATIRIARLGRQGAVECLDRTWNDNSRTDEERFVAVECLARVPDDPEARLKAYNLALGPARPVADLGERNRDHPIRDLRSAAVMAVMQSGDQTLARKLIESADAGGVDPSVKSMVDLHIGSYQGADISRVVFGRIEHRGDVTLGEVRYLNRACTAADVEALHGIRDKAKDPALRELLDGAILNAMRRR